MLARGNLEMGDEKDFNTMVACARALILTTIQTVGGGRVKPRKRG